MRSSQRHLTGIDMQRLNEGKPRTSQRGPRQDAGSVSGPHARLLRKDNFHSETGKLGVDRQMCVMLDGFADARLEYIEGEMLKRRGVAPPADVVERGVRDPTDELYQVAEKYRQLAAEAAGKTLGASRADDDESATLSSEMLGSIAEVDLGLEYVGTMSESPVLTTGPACRTSPRRRRHAASCTRSREQRTRWTGATLRHLRARCQHVSL